MSAVLQAFSNNLFNESYSQGFNSQQVSIGSDNGLALNRQQPIILTNDGFVYRPIYASLCFIDLN